MLPFQRDLTGTEVLPAALVDSRVYEGNDVQPATYEVALVGDTIV